MTQRILLSFALIFAASLALADASPQCAQTGWPCRMDACCSILDYCAVTGVCTPKNRVQDILAKAKVTKPEKSTPMTATVRE